MPRKNELEQRALGSHTAALRLQAEENNATKKKNAKNRRQEHAFKEQARWGK